MNVTELQHNHKMKEEKTIFKPSAGIEPHIFGLLVRRVNHYTTRTTVNVMYEVTAGIPRHYFLYE